MAVCAVSLREPSLLKTELSTSLDTATKNCKVVRAVYRKGDKPARVALPLLATFALEYYLVQRGLPVCRQRWNPGVVLLPSLADDQGGVTTSRLWAVPKRFFGLAATQLAPILFT